MSLPESGSGISVRVEDSTTFLSSHEVLLAAPSDSVVSVDSFPTENIKKDFFILASLE
jgi:hypothetical protein